MTRSATDTMPTDRELLETAAAWDLLEPHTAAPEVIRARRDALDYARKAGERRWLREPGRRTALRIAACAVAAVALGASVWPLVDGVDD
jgi:hypothetical protein